MTEVSSLNVEYNGNVYRLTIYEAALVIERQGGGQRRSYDFDADDGLPVHAIYAVDGHVWNHAAIHQLIAAYEASIANGEPETAGKSAAPERPRKPDFATASSKNGRKSSFAGNENLENSLADLPQFTIYWQARRNGKFLRAGLINVRAVSALEAQEAIREIQREMRPMLGPGAELTFNSAILGEDNVALHGTQ
ncbi:MAG TPA: hypothetical protein VKQ72_05960 [Aggregatilineales bacterium]|nr:hypothetical protein [Aggregatilineales bacterium]